MAEDQQKLSAEIMLQDAQEAIQDDDLEGALELLRMATELDPNRIELEGYVDLVRTRLLKSYRDRVGDVGAIPRVVASIDSITRFNLPSDAGFFLSLVDGSTSIGELVSLSGMDAFDAYRILNRLIDAEIAVVRS